MLAKTDAGGPGLLPEMVRFTSSIRADRGLLREDLIGSLAHVVMLSRTGILEAAAARVIKNELAALWQAAADDPAHWPLGDDEEDVHMAVEAELTRRLGETGGLLHAARSRNDQVALDLRLHVRETCRRALVGIGQLIAAIADRALAEIDVVMPAYTHRQRAQPISFGYLLCAYGFMLSRDVDALGFVLSQVDAMPLGVGAIAGTSLSIDRELTRSLLGFSRLTDNGLDTVGDRDFCLDLSYAVARFLLHTSRIATDFVDFASAEFGFLKLDGTIACGSSMMPQKKNPDVFELVRGKSGQAVGNLLSLMVVLKGLPAGYNRDLQEDRSAVLGARPLLEGVMAALVTALPRVTVDRERCLRAVDEDYTQATDLAEALVHRGVPFRRAYRLVGTLVHHCQQARVPLAEVTLKMAQRIAPEFDAEVIEQVSAAACVARKESPGGTGPGVVRKQIAELRKRAHAATARAKTLPTLEQLFLSINGTEL